MAGAEARAGGRMTLRCRISRRGVLARAAAGAALLPLPAIAELRAVKFTLAWLAQGSFAYVYVARAKGIMKARGIDFDIARGTRVFIDRPGGNARAVPERGAPRSPSTPAPRNSPASGSACGSTASIARRRANMGWDGLMRPAT